MVSPVFSRVVSWVAVSALAISALYFLLSLSVLPATCFACASAASLTSPEKSCWNLPWNFSFAGFGGGGGGSSFFASGAGAGGAAAGAADASGAAVLAGASAGASPPHAGRIAAARVRRIPYDKRLLFI